MMVRLEDVGTLGVVELRRLDDSLLCVLGFAYIWALACEFWVFLPGA